MNEVELHQGDCLELLKTLPDASVDLILTDPPYPMIKRDYGFWTEEEWREMMDEVTAECRRVLKPSGSAVFILQPNYDTCCGRGLRVRLWLWEWAIYWAKQWNWVQDAYWWNFKTIPSYTAIQARAMRSSIKPVFWFGEPDCYRNQEAVLWEVGKNHLAADAQKRITREKMKSPSGHSRNAKTMHQSILDKDGGVTPYNLLPFENGHTGKGIESGKFGHNAGTPLALADWWTRFLSPPGGLVLDPFCGAGTMAIAAAQNGRRFIGFEKEAEYVELTRRRLAGLQRPLLVA